MFSFGLDSLSHGVEEIDQRKHEGEVEGTVPPFLEHAEAGGVNVKNGKHQGHSEGQLENDACHRPKPHLRIVLGNFVHVFLQVGR